MQAFLYTVLVYILTFWIKPTTMHFSLIILGLVIFAGGILEGLQIITTAEQPVWPAEIFDLSLDLSGSLIG
jgi:hypothetical protein